MPRTKISEFSATPANNTDIDSINIAEGCAPSGINDAIRELMAQLKDFQTGAVGDSFNGPVGSTTAGTGAFTTLSASGTATLSGLTASTALALDASKNIVSVTNTGTGSNVLATSPTLVTPALGTPSSGVVTNLTGTASININGTVGATTATTGAFTTLAASSTVTLSGGTANGVAYLNGSKVVTSGSALTFDGTTLGVSNGSAGSAGISITGTYSGSGTVAFLNFQRAGGAVAGTLGYNDASTAIQFGTTTNHSTIFLQNNAEAMRLTSTGLGIGTSSPSTKLHVNTGSAGYGITVAASSQTGATYQIGIDSNSALAIYDSAATAQRLVLSNSGNLGLGVTPSAWGADNKTIQLPAGSISSYQTIAQEYAQNCFFDGTNWKYVASTFAERYTQYNGQHQWHTAASGTAGNAITFTQAMTLDASGNLLVGTTSAGGAKLAIQGGSILVRTDGDILKVNDVADSTYYFRITRNASNLEIVNRQSGALTFSTSDTERARIDTSGNLLIDTTSTSGAQGFAFVSSGSSSVQRLIIGHKVGNGTGDTYHEFNYNSSQIGSITQNGTTGVLYNLTSDYRLKNNPTELTGSGEFIDALQPKTWDWWDGSGKGVGFIAHEFMDVAKYSGNGEKDAVDAEGKPVYQSIQPSSSEVMANLVAEIKALRLRVAQLEAQ